MTRLRLYSEDIDGRSILYALDLPGCYAEGVSEDEALGCFPLAWASYADWLVSHGDVASAQPERFVIAERFESYVLPDGYEVTALFTPERRPPSRRFIALPAIAGLLARRSPRRLAGDSGRPPGRGPD